MEQHILVVDDENDVRNLMVSVLSEAGYRVSALESAVDLTAHVDRTGPDLIILDLTMPEIDGFEALADLKLNIKTAQIPVVIASAQAQRETLLRARDLGAVDFIIKPWDEGEVEWRVGHILDRFAQAA